MDLSELRASMLAVEGVKEVHDIHVWTITSGLDAMSGHVRIDERANAEPVLDSLTTVLKDQFWFTAHDYSGRTGRPAAAIRMFAQNRRSSLPNRLVCQVKSHLRATLATVYDRNLRIRCFYH